MGILEIVSGVLLIFCSIIVILLVLAQEAKTNGMSAMTGGSDVYADMQSRTNDARLAKVTKYAAAAFIILTVAVGAIVKFVK